MDGREQARRWVEAWKRAGPDLERMRREEIRARTPEDQRRAIADVLGLCPRRPPRRTSGLVALQDAFRRTRR